VQRLLVDLVAARRDARDAVLDRGHRDVRGLLGEHLRLVHRRHDVVGVDALLLREVRDRVGCRDRHLVGDLARPNEERPLEDARKAHRVVDLVGEVAAPRGHDVRAGFLRRVRVDLRHRVGAREDDRLARHLADPLRLHGFRARLAQRDQDVRPLQGVVDVGYAPRVGLLAQLPLPVEGRVRLHVVASLVQAALGVEEGHLLGVAARHQDQPGDRRVRRPRAVQDDPDLVDVLADDAEGVDQAGERDAARALRVVVPDGDVAFLPQGVEDLVAVRLRDVFEVDGAETRLQHLHELDDLVGIVLAGLVVAVHAQRHAVDASQVLHQVRLALHHAEAARGRAIAVTEDAGRVRDHGDQVAAVRQVEGEVVVVANGRGNGRDAGRVPHVEPVEAVDARLGHRHHLAAVELVGGEGQLLQENGFGLCQLFLREACREQLVEVRKREVDRLHRGLPERMSASLRVTGEDTTPCRPVAGRRHSLTRGGSASFEGIIRQEGPRVNPLLLQPAPRVG